MDESLFVKHFLQIKKQKDSKEEIISFLEEKIGISCSQSEFTISKKEITFQISSVKKAKLLQKKVKELLEEKGYKVRL